MGRRGERKRRVDALVEQARRLQLRGKPELLSEEQRESILVPVRSAMRPTSRRDPPPKVLENILVRTEHAIIQYRIDAVMNVSDPLSVDQIRSELVRVLGPTQELLADLSTMTPAARHALGDKAELATSERHRGARVRPGAPQQALDLEGSTLPVLEDLRRHLVRAIEAIEAHPAPRRGRRPRLDRRWLAEELAGIWRECVRAPMSRDAYDDGPWVAFVKAVFTAAGEQEPGTTYARTIASSSS